MPGQDSFRKAKDLAVKYARSPKFWLPFIFLLLVFCYAYRPIEDPDSFYHLKAGELIWQTKSIPHADVFSYTAQGSRWVPHEWLAEIIFYGIWYFSGFYGLISFCSLLAVFAYFLIYRMMLARGADYRFSALFIFIFGYLTLELWIPRPQIFAYTCLVLLVYFLDRYRQDGKNKNLFWATGIVWFWANTNASFILGIAVLGLYFLSAMAGKHLKMEGFYPATPIKLFLALLAGAGISLINPSGYHIWLYSRYILPAVQTLKVLEWLPVWDYLYQFRTKFFMSEMVLAGLFLAYWTGWRKQSRDLTQLGLVLGISILPFISVRHVGFWPLVAILPLGVSISDMFKKSADMIFSRRVLYILAVLGLAMFLGKVFVWPRLFFNPDRIPYYAAEFLEQNNIKGPGFNLYNEGGFLIWKLWPREKVFVDGRSEVYPRAVLDELALIYNAYPGWEKLVDEKYKINYFLLSYRGASQDINSLVRALFERKWPMVFWDDAAIIFIRPSPENMDLIKKYALVHINPYRLPGEIPQEESVPALEEVKRLLEQNKSSVGIQNYGKDIISTRKPSSRNASSSDSASSSDPAR